MDYKIRILHLYRSLLRSASYLPDSLARVRIHNEVVHRFHKQQHNRRYSLPQNAHRTVSNLQKHSKKLQRAADLHTNDLAAVLSSTYGRRGSRKRMLLSTLINSPNMDLLSNSTSLQEFVLQSSQHRSTHRYGNNQKLAALLKSQKQNVGVEKIKHLSPPIPTHNIWMLKTPVKARANMERKWWAKTLDKIFPPVEEEEWTRLQRLAQGYLVEDAPTRRHCPEPTAVERTADPGIDTWLFRVRGATPHNRRLSIRGLRKLYSTIWAQTPLMKFNATKKQWETQWGNESSLSKNGLEAVPKANGNKMELFEGVELLPETGKIKKKGFSSQSV